MAALMNSIPIWLLFIIVFTIGMIAAQVGVRIGKLREQRGVKEKDPGGAVVAAMLGLLAFMLGFTFSITSNRFADRKQLIIEQANAIGTCFLRTDLLPAQKKNESRRLLKEYTDLLISSRKEPENMKVTIEKFESLNMQIWKQAASLQHDSIDSELRSLFVSSVNDIVNVFTERKTIALVYRVHGMVWAVLLLLYVLGLIVLGSEATNIRGRRIINVPIMCAAIALVVSLVADMDASSKRLGNFEANQQPLLDVQRMIRGSEKS